MKHYNKTTLIGKIEQSPEIKKLNNGEWSVIKFPIMVRRNRKDKDIYDRLFISKYIKTEDAPHKLGYNTDDTVLIIGAVEVNIVGDKFYTEIKADVINRLSGFDVLPEIDKAPY